MIFDIRGTNGSGKSHIIHALIAEFGITSLHEDDTERVVGTEIGRNMLALGSYARVCGGCDGISKQDYICDLLRHFDAQYPVVLLEGILVSHTFGRWNEMSTELDDYQFFFLDTQMSECRRRVVQRRHTAGNFNPYDDKNMVKDWHQCRRVKERLDAAGKTTHWIAGYEDFKRYLP